MQLQTLVPGFVAMVVISTGAFAQEVTADYNKDTDFSRYKTYRWIKEPETENPLMRQRVIDDVNDSLRAKGLRLVTSDADLCIAAHAATREQQTLNTFYDGFAGGWRWRGTGLGSATTTVSTYDVGTLVVDIFDASTKEAIWRGTASKTLSSNPQKNTAAVNKAIDKMFKNFPPLSKSN